MIKVKLSYYYEDDKEYGTYIMTLKEFQDMWNSVSERDKFDYYRTHKIEFIVE